MFRPVRQFTIKSLLLLVPLVAGLVVGMRKVVVDIPVSYYDFTDDLIPFGVLFWLLPLALSLFVRSLGHTFVMSLIGYYAIVMLARWIYFQNGLPPLLPSYFFPLERYAMLTLLWPALILTSELSLTDSVAWKVYYCQGVLYAFSGVVFGMTCHLRESPHETNLPVSGE